MKIVYLLSMCSFSEYERLFIKYKTTSSHASQRFHRLITLGMIENGVDVETVTYRSIKNLDVEECKERIEVENNIT